MKQVHSEKAYQCTICNKKFTKNRDKNRNVITVHEGKKPNECKICLKRYGHKADTKRHVEIVHEGQKP